FLTHKMPGGVHVRLDAPLEHRIAHLMEDLHVKHEEAARHARDLSKRRAAFYKRYWPSEVVRPDLFTVTLNMAEISQETSAKIIVVLVKEWEQGKTPAPEMPPVAETSARH